MASKRKAKPKKTAAKKKRGKRETNSRDRILNAAMQEFSAYGYSGARIDRITRNAEANPRMLYHFFESKRGLLDAVLSEIFKRRLTEMAETPHSIYSLLELYFDGFAADRHRVRLLEWEALEAKLRKDDSDLTNFDDRRDVVAKRVKIISDLQSEGKLPNGIDADLLYLIFVALTIYPMSYPQSVMITTGEDAFSERFRARYRAALLKLALLLDTATREEKRDNK
ncbi:TetR/AcrR family transcriptional regulator [Hyphococcus luteus]|uniref:HTH tetR-type domain-containing protein n=1 Tax=Hyphococcus luteus TaxID=2058213 RepID=A0A2S7K581_9PROT|nr:TetR/AcrR family transcriptional regulator [Marinicaulis flavus]PQA87649.1 hypothetical protein CW354_11275 [Marinicaulis flavus]